MSKPRYIFWSYIKAVIRKYPQPHVSRTSTAYREYIAVKQAIDETEHYANGRDRLKVIRLVLWDKSHDLAGAALQIPCSEETAKHWHGDFIRAVAKWYGLMDE